MFSEVWIPFFVIPSAGIEAIRINIILKKRLLLFIGPIPLNEERIRRVNGSHSREFQLLNVTEIQLQVVFFTNSGTEANELALMMARLYTGYHDIISIRNSYHGNATSTMGVTAQFYHKFNVVQTGVHHVLNPDPYRGVFGLDGAKYANDVQDIINHGTCGHVAGFVAEAIQGVGGVIELAPGYLPGVYSIIKKAGGVFIADEVQSGFGRTGSHFWGFEAHGIVPDIVTLAKGIGNGAPIGAVVTTPEIAKVLKYAYYFSTFGGNPVCAAAGLAVLNVIEKDKLQQNAYVVGSYLKDRLNSLMEKHERLVLNRKTE